ncbi:alpha/beta hydrolase [Lysinibacter sp. HNR]|uniref:alpha/beta hydrolase n=1 Tax=Lysinibacter sp. HNR TaxID=3031408 RepID=UPI002435A46E|nr:alpha/beta hydrolase [Lysinibacter sp. HNR]WGD37073.1 alpha/beta hydrolase [Lysinibacter sp. HNR]
MYPTRFSRAGVLVAFGVVATFLAGCVSVAPVERTSTPAADSSVPAELQEYYGQELTWTSCDDDMECALAEAPLNWAEPSGEKIQLALVRQSALGGTAQGSLFVNPGGPGASGVDYISQNISGAVGKPLQEAFDVIGFDPRGVGQSSAVACFDAQRMDEYLFGVADNPVGTDAWIQETRESARELGEACQTNTGALLQYVDTVSAARDLDMLRSVVGDSKLNYLGYSYGTYLGAHYAELFPQNVGRLVLDGAIDPATSNFEVIKTQTIGFENAMKAFLADCIGSSGCPYRGTVDEAMAQVGSLLDSVQNNPITASDGRRLSSGTLLTALITPLYSQEAWPALKQILTATIAGNADLAFLSADLYHGREDGKYKDNSFEAFMGINCLDYEYNDDVSVMRAQASELAAAAPTFGRFQGYGDIGCAQWPYKNTTPRGELHAEGADPILVIGTTNDPATPYEWAVALSEQLDSGVLVTYVGEGHTAYSSSNACVADVVESYFLRGTVPDTDPRCESQ